MPDDVAALLKMTQADLDALFEPARADPERRGRRHRDRRARHRVYARNRGLDQPVRVAGQSF
jgi:hypothetical protein